MSLTFPIHIETPLSTLFVVFCFLFSFISLLLIYSSLRNINKIIRPSTIIAIFFAIFLQIPMALIAGKIEEALSNEWLFAFSVNFIPVALLAWGGVTPGLDSKYRARSRPVVASMHLTVPLGLSIILAGLYFQQVPIDCTAAFAMLFDPEVSLLAREFAGKIAATRLSGYSLGAMVNTTAPFALTLLVWSSVSAFERRSYIIAFAYISASLGLLGMVLIAGAKGHLFPSILVLAIASVIWIAGRWQKMATALTLAAILGAGLVSFELIGTRETTSNQQDSYSFGACSARAGTCAKSAELIESLLSRDYALRIGPDRLERIVNEMEVECPDVDIALATVDPAITHANAGNFESLVAKGILYAKGIGYRAFIIPIQVGSWHFLYASEFGPPGLNAMPLARYFAVTPLNMPELVYQAYGSVYAEGDRTSTSTSPTSFIIAYPAYIGAAGLILALLAVLVFDVLWSMLVRLIPPSLVAPSIGLLAVVAMNLVLSDFVVVMTTHGGAMAIVLLALLALPALCRRRRARKRQ